MTLLRKRKLKMYRQNCKTSNGLSKQLLVIFASFPSVKGIGEDSGGSESAPGINLPSFTYEIYINLPILERTLARERPFKVATYGV